MTKPVIPDCTILGNKNVLVICFLIIWEKNLPFPLKAFCFHKPIRKRNRRFKLRPELIEFFSVCILKHSLSQKWIYFSAFFPELCIFFNSVSIHQKGRKTCPCCKRKLFTRVGISYICNLNPLRELSLEFCLRENLEKISVIKAAFKTFTKTVTVFISLSNISKALNKRIWQIINCNRLINISGHPGSDKLIKGASD